MEAFYAGSGGDCLEFHGRIPADSSLPIDEFGVRIVQHNLSAEGAVYAGYTPSHPAPLFAEMAQKWAGWHGALAWTSLEGQLSLRCTHDRRGHVAMHVELRPGLLDLDWSVRATIMVEAGQLEFLAKQAASFFGAPSLDRS